MKQSLSGVTVVVDDYDAAIAFYVGVLGFDLIDDTPIGAKRWVRVRPRGGETALVLARGEGARQTARIGDQTGGRVFLFLETDDFDRDYVRYRDAGVRFQESPREESYGRVAVFADPYGNLWDLIEPSSIKQHSLS